MNKAKVARSLKNAASKLKQRAKNLEDLSSDVANSAHEDEEKRAYIELLNVKRGLNEALDEVLAEFGEDKAVREGKRQLDPEVVKRIRAAFGSRPDLPPGEEYVERMKELWAGLLRKRDE